MNEFKYHIDFIVVSLGAYSYKGTVSLCSNIDLRTDDKSMQGMLDYVNQSLEEQFPKIEFTMLTIREFLE